MTRRTNCRAGYQPEFLATAAVDATLTVLSSRIARLLGVNLRQRAHAPTNLIACIIPSNPRILNTRLKL